MLRILNLQLLRQRCNVLARAFFKVGDNIFVFKTHLATHGVVAIQLLMNV
jgi:hypothetical protein